MNLWVPFSPARRLKLRALLSMQVHSLDEFARLRAQTSGRWVEPKSLEALLSRERGFSERFFGRILPSVFKHAQGLLAREEPSLAIHEAGESAVTVLPRRDVAGWVAHMVLGTLPGQGVLHPDTDFARLFQGETAQHSAKLRCVFEYFDQIFELSPQGRFELSRRVLPARSSPGWAADRSALTALSVDHSGVIEDAHAHLQVDFANAFLGGGVLRAGCVQEEIRFSVAPEFLAAMILSPRMGDDEAIVMRGAERFALTRGYAHSLEYAGPFKDPVARAPDGTPDVDFVAIDAVDYRRGDPKRQFDPDEMLREVNKARAGWIRDARALPVATGNWGCGAFRGDVPLKAVLQWIAASAEGRSVRYFSFGDLRVGALEDFAKRARESVGTSGALWSRVLAAADPRGGPGLYDRLLS